MKYIFMIFPVFAMTNGYLSISLRSLIATMAAGRYTTYTPFDYRAAGPNLLFLVFSIPFFWFLFIISEGEYWANYKKNRARGG